MSARQADGLVVRVVTVVAVASAVMVGLMAWAAVAQPMAPHNDAWTVVQVGPAFMADVPVSALVEAPLAAPAPATDARLCVVGSSRPTVQ